MAEEYKVVHSPEIKDEELPEVHYHNDIDQPAIALGDLPAGTDHSTLSNVTIDQHHARDHASRHLSGGGDALTLTAAEVPTGTSWAASIVPDADSTRNIGSTSRAYADIYVDTIKSITGNPLALTPIAGQSLTVNLSSTGDLIVNTNHLVVDTSVGNVGIGITAPTAKLHLVGSADTQQLIVKAFSTQTTNLAEFQNSSAVIQLAIAGNGRDIILDTTTGSKIGTATSQKLGFWNVTPIVQPAGATQAAPAAYVTGAFGLDTNVKMQALYDLVVAMRTALVNSGIMKGAA